jgi:hypothetical protein
MQTYLQILPDGIHMMSPHRMQILMVARLVHFWNELLHKFLLQVNYCPAKGYFLSSILR